MKFLPILKKVLLWSTLIVVLTGAFVFFCNYWVFKYSKDRVFADLDSLPANDVALVLGTNPYIHRKDTKFKNLYFEYRLNAAIALYEAGKVKHFILSGDNSRKTYDEPTEMKAGLMARGVPEAAITLDYAGFRTLDSVVRSKAIFQQQKLTIISQEFHNYRAVFLAGQHGIDAVAFNAKTVPYRGSKLRIEVREFLARTKAILDVFVLRKSPKFLGEKITIQL